MGIRVIDDTTGAEIPVNDSTNFSGRMTIYVGGVGEVFARDLGPFFISKNGTDNLLDNPQWQQIYALFQKMMPSVTSAWDAMVADINRIIVTTSPDIVPALEAGNTGPGKEI